MQVQSDADCAEDCELDEFAFDNDDLLGTVVASPKAKVKTSLWTTQAIA